ncbi:MAG: GNAT family N-acetyltransferase [Phycisphaerales bacterium]
MSNVRAQQDPGVIEIVDAHSPPLLDAAREIVREYGRAIEHVAACSLQYQRFEDELAGLPGVYAPPRGRLLLAFSRPPAPTPGRSDIERPIGCVALRPLPALGSSVCELKRMYVRPEARGRGLGAALARRIISDAAAAGYSLMKLDTSSTMLEAQALYRRLGFVPCAAYNADPAEDTLWFERVLRPDDADL